MWENTISSCQSCQAPPQNFLGRGGKVWGGRGFLTLPAPLGVSQALVAAIILNHLEVLLAEAEGPDRASPCPAGLRAGVHALGWGPP